MNMPVRVSGRCECGRVRFTVTHPRDTVTVCHCGQCRRTSGHLWASTQADFQDLVFQQEEGLTWYASSALARRAFCRHCGSSLFYRLNDEPGVAIAAGCLDAPTGFTIGKHIHVADKGDYYDIDDGRPQFDQS